MATLNLQTTSSILGKTTTVSLSGTSVTSLLSNASSSGFVYKVRSIIVANAGAAAANITVAYYSAAALGGTAYPIVSTVSIPAKGVLPILDSNTFIYMPDDSSIGVTAGTANYLTVTCAYEQVTADAIPSTGPSPGGLWVGGQNNLGQLGQGNTIYRSSPVQVGSDSTWSKVSTSYSSVAIKSNGTLWTWGNNYNGQLGQNNRTSLSSPVQVGALTNWSSADCTNSSIFAIKTDGTLWTWGYNYSGNLGQNDRVARSSPVQVGALTDWSKAIKLGAIKTDGSLWLWGPGANGRIGNLSLINRSSPVQVAGTWTWVDSAYTCVGVKSTGTLWAWGNNANGQLGQNDIANRSSPVQIGALTNWSISNNVVIGSYSPRAIKTDGTLWTWGQNNNGQLGQNDVVLRSSPVQVGSDANWSMVSITHGLKTTGALWAIGGTNNHGQLLLDDKVKRSSPVQVGALTTWQFIGSGFGSNNNTFCGIKT